MMKVKRKGPFYSTVWLLDATHLDSKALELDKNSLKSKERTEKKRTVHSSMCDSIYIGLNKSICRKLLGSMLVCDLKPVTALKGIINLKDLLVCHNTTRQSKSLAWNRSSKEIFPLWKIYLLWIYIKKECFIDNIQ